MSSSGSFKYHVDHATTKARQLCGWILRTFATRAVFPMMTLCKSLVLPHVDYCSQLWCPTNPGEISKMETIQRTFIRKIPSVRNLSYWEQLKYLKLFSLQRRRERYRIIYLWKILENQVPQIGELKAIIHKRNGRLCYMSNIKSSASARIKTIRHGSFSIHAPQLFNSLPKDIRNISGCSVDVFKRELDKYLQRIPDEPLIKGYVQFRRAESNSILHMRKFASPPTKHPLNTAASHHSSAQIHL